MPRKPPAPRKQEFDPTTIRDISERVYAMRLGKDAAKMVAEVGTVRFRERAAAYDDLTAIYLRAMRDQGAITRGPVALAHEDPQPAGG